MDGARRNPPPWQGGLLVPAEEGELFVPFSVLPAQGPAQDAPLAIRVQSIEGLANVSASRLSLEFRFGPVVAGLRIDKKKEVSIKCHMDILKERGGTKWCPAGAEGTRGAVLRVALPPLLLAQQGQGTAWACRIKVTSPGLVSANALAASAPVQVPLEPGPLQLMSTKAGQNKGTPVALAVLSIGRLFTAEVQAVLAKNLVGQLLRHFRRPSSGGSQPTLADAAVGDLKPTRDGKVPPELEALRPSRGWLPGAGLKQAFAATDFQRRSALRLAVDGRHWACVLPLVEAQCDPRALAEDLRSPLTASLETGDHLDVMFAASPALAAAEPQRVAIEFADLLAEVGISGGCTDPDLMRRWEALAGDLAAHFQPPPGAKDWPCDVFVLALEHCPSAKVRRTFLCGDGACAALWQASLAQNLPSLARKLAVWIGLSSNSATVSASEGRQSRRRLLDAPLEHGVEDTMLARCLQRATEDERWLQVARVMIHLGACTNTMTADGRSCLLFTLEQADHGRSGFRPLLAALLDKLGDDVDHWERPMVLHEDRTAECPICMETLWTSTPTAFVKFRSEGGREGAPHVICAHFFCFDCASQQYIKQQSQNTDEYHCPICRTNAVEVMPLPDITREPRLWFQFLDTQGAGSLDKNTVVQALEAVLPLDTENLRAAMEAHCWTEWAKGGAENLSEGDFFSRGGLLEWVRGHQHELQAARVRGPAPALEQPESWFKHWDFHKRCLLFRGEALRALCEATNASSLETQKVQKLRDGIEGVWDSHGVEDGLSKEVFIEEGIAGELAEIVREAKESTSSAPSPLSGDGFGP